MLKRIFSLSLTALVGLTLGMLMLEGLLRYQSEQILQQYRLDPVSEYYETEEGIATLRDHETARTRYAPYVVWVTANHTSDNLNVTDGVRFTPGATCGERSYRVFVFGGSTVFGFATPDGRTIPAYIQQQLAAQRDDPVCVVNYGTAGYTTTQDVIRLLQLLQVGDVPDVAIFYNGANDVIMAVDAGLQAHSNQPSAALRFERPLDAVLTENSLLYGTLRNHFRPYRQDIPAMERISASPEDLAMIYEANYTAAQLLAEGYDFEMGFLLQPILPVTAKELSANEAYLLGRIDVKYGSFQQDTYALIAERMQGQEGFHNLSDLFDGERQTVWVDEVHIAPPHHEGVAAAILAQLAD
ncbi:MAG: SGNH/GDSL hydrolase family protein [Chloroflexota bacterium]